MNLNNILFDNKYRLSERTNWCVYFCIRNFLEKIAQSSLIKCKKYTDDASHHPGSINIYSLPLLAKQHLKSYREPLLAPNVNFADYPSLESFNKHSY